MCLGFGVRHIWSMTLSTCTGIGCSWWQVYCTRIVPRLQYVEGSGVSKHEINAQKVPCYSNSGQAIKLDKWFQYCILQRYVASFTCEELCNTFLPNRLKLGNKSQVISVVRRFRCLLHEILSACCESRYCRFSMCEPLWTYLARVDTYICWI